ncbi:hypothetical protein HPB52_009085 [Rhipicephalus sanguineus]|uniref:Uncharacterized protein n=1 Tax=Rhipicephalus sanguineus TaxID=34632 RepID=A0A9D4SS20_RHISA|nr:hypothetical protein HPB52_009085 [Rhipicephalus sanguineus]
MSWFRHAAERAATLQKKMEAEKCFQDGEGECDRGNIEEIAEEIDAKGDRQAEKVGAGVVLVDFRDEDDGVREIDGCEGRSWRARGKLWKGGEAQKEEA